MKKVFILICHIGLLVPTGAFAGGRMTVPEISGTVLRQDTVTGIVSDEKDVPLPGVNVIVKGKKIGTITDGEGRFRIEASSEDMLEFSFIGFETRLVKVRDKEPMKVTLLEDTMFLEETVVIGYGVQKKKLVTGATVQVDGDAISKLNTVSPLAALQSQTPGVNITKISGQPGSKFKVVIRGLGTIGNAEPLYVIDGLPGNMDELNPADIASIDVLKDAASAAIYGARGANGVVLVTTRKGSAGKSSIEFNGYYGYQRFIRNVRPLNAQEYVSIITEAANNIGSPVPDFANLVPDWDRIQNGWKGTDWLEEMINDKSFVQNYSVSARGGSENSVYSVSFSYTLQDGTFGVPVTPVYERYTGMVNGEHVIVKGRGFDILKVGENVRYGLSKDNGIQINGSQSDMRHAVSVHPLFPVYDESGKYHKSIDYDEGRLNPVAEMYYKEGHNEHYRHTLSGDLFMELQPLKNLKIRSSFGYSFSNNSTRKYVPVHSLSNDKFSTEDEVMQAMDNNWHWRNETTVNYDWNAAEKHHFDILFGYAVSKSDWGMSIKGANYNSIFSDFDHAWLDNTPDLIAGRTRLGGKPAVQTRGMSAFGRINYDYDEKYMATAVFRADGSSKFAKGHRWGYFPSVSAGWVITNEPWMQRAKSYMDFFKIRASWGQNGNNAIAPFQYFSNIASDSKYFFGPGKDLAAIGSYPANNPNKDIKWETSEQVDVGIDARFFDSRLALNLDWYNKTTKDWLVAAPIPGIMGAAPSDINGGDIRNTGVELALGWKDDINELKYGFNLNLSYNRNEITSIANSEGIIHGAGGLPWNGCAEIYKAQVGYPIGYFYGFKTDGLFQNEEEVRNYEKDGSLILPDAQPGDIRFVDINNDGVINDDDKTMIGDPNPDVMFGLNFNMGYRGFDFSVATNGVAGNQIFRAYRHATIKQHNYTSEILDRWHGEGTSNSIPRVTYDAHINQTYVSDKYIEDGTYWRISNITIGYDFKNLFPRACLSSAKLYFTGQNLATLTKYKGFDPEIGGGSPSHSWASGVDLGFYPIPRVFMIGVSIRY